MCRSSNKVTSEVQCKLWSLCHIQAAPSAGHYGYCFQPITVIRPHTESFHERSPAYQLYIKLYQWYTDNSSYSKTAASLSRLSLVRKGKLILNLSSVCSLSASCGGIFITSLQSAELVVDDTRLSFPPQFFAKPMNNRHKEANVQLYWCLRSVKFFLTLWIMCILSF